MVLEQHVLWLLMLCDLLINFKGKSDTLPDINLNYVIKMWS